MPLTQQQKLDEVEIIRRRMSELIQEMSVLEQQLYNLTTNEEDPE